MVAFASTRSRVPHNTAEEINQRIRQQTEDRLRYYSEHSDQIDTYLAELDREWDIERAIEANAASLVLGGLALSVTVSRAWLIVPAIVGGFLLQHAVQGWCPPVPLFRRMGYRTQPEIEEERSRLIELRDSTKRTVAGENL